MCLLKAEKLLLVVLCVFFAMYGASCFSADKEPDDEDAQVYPDDDDDDVDDDDNVDDDADDDVDDDADDDIDDDVDDDADDDTQPPLNCDDIMELVYDLCEDVFVWKNPPNQDLSRSEAIDECLLGGPFWECVENCLGEVSENCGDMEQCVNDAEDGCEGPLLYNRLG